MVNILIETGDLTLTNRIINIEDIINIMTKYLDTDKDQLKKILEKS